MMYEIRYVDLMYWKIRKVGHDVEYDIQIDGNGNLNCECEGFRFNKKCRHLELFHKANKILWDSPATIAYEK